MANLGVNMQGWGEGNGSPLQSSHLENPLDGGAWLAAVHGVAKSGTQLSDFTFTFHLLALEKEMATHSSVLAWRIPGMGEPGGLPSVGSHRVRHDWSDLAAAAAACRAGWFGAWMSQSLSVEWLCFFPSTVQWCKNYILQILGLHARVQIIK